MYIDDDIVKHNIDIVKSFNWANCKLYVIGGVLNKETKSKDIDIAIFGNLTNQVKNNMKKCEKLSGYLLDMQYYKTNGPLKPGDQKKISFGKINSEIPTKRGRRKFKGQWEDDGLFWVINWKNKEILQNAVLIYNGV
jgi:hypothetical protein